jgi:hypothetical protein
VEGVKKRDVGLQRLGPSGCRRGGKTKREKEALPDFCGHSLLPRSVFGFVPHDQESMPFLPPLPASWQAGSGSVSHVIASPAEAGRGDPHGIYYPILTARLID